jgi:hypothetical protein
MPQDLNQLPDAVIKTITLVKEVEELTNEN